MSSPTTTEILDEVVLDGVAVPMASGGITEESDPTVPEHIKAISQNEVTQWNNNTALIESLQNDKAGKDEIPTKTSELTNDSGFITSNSTTITNLQTKDTELEGLITSLSSKITELETKVTVLEETMPAYTLSGTDLEVTFKE